MGSEQGPNPKPQIPSSVCSQSLGDALKGPCPDTRMARAGGGHPKNTGATERCLLPAPRWEAHPILQRMAPAGGFHGVVEEEKEEKEEEEEEGGR